MAVGEVIEMVSDLVIVENEKTPVSLEEWGMAVGEVIEMVSDLVIVENEKNVKGNKSVRGVTVTQKQKQPVTGVVQKQMVTGVAAVWRNKNLVLTLQFPHAVI